MCKLQTVSSVVGIAIYCPSPQNNPKSTHASISGFLSSFLSPHIGYLRHFDSRDLLVLLKLLLVCCFNYHVVSWAPCEVCFKGTVHPTKKLNFSPFLRTPMQMGKLGVAAS